VKQHHLERVVIMIIQHVWLMLLVNVDDDYDDLLHIIHVTLQVHVIHIRIDLHVKLHQDERDVIIVIQLVW